MIFDLQGVWGRLFLPVVFDLQTFALTNDCVHIKVHQVIQLLVVAAVYFGVIHCALGAQGLVALTLKRYEWRLCYRNLAF